MNLKTHNKKFDLISRASRASSLSYYENIFDSSAAKPQYETN